MPEYPYPPPQPFSWQLLLINCTLMVLLTSVLLKIVLICFRRRSGSDLAAWMLGLVLVTGMVNAQTAKGLGYMPLAWQLEWFKGGVFGLWILMSVGTAISLIRWMRMVTTDVPMTIFAGIFFFGVLLTPFVFASVTTPREVARRAQCRNLLKQIGLAIHSYHDDFHSFPTGPLLAEPHSWRVDLLPYLDQRELYQQYRLDKAWDGEHNRTLQPNRPTEYACPSFMNGDHEDDLSSISSYVALTGPGTLYDAARPTLTFSDVNDGASQTLAIVEACGLRRIWTDPSDADVEQLPMRINRPGHQRGTSVGTLSSYHRQGAHGLMVDGSVRFLADDTDPQVLEALATSRGGEDVSDTFPW